MNVKLDGLRALVAVVDAGSFTDAATELHLSQAAVSRAVAGLERAVGGRVLQRSTRRLQPTALGARVLPAARHVLDAVAALERTVEEDRRELRVGYAWSALGRHTGVLQRRWAAEEHTTRLVFQQIDTPVAGLDTGVVDVAVVRRPVDPARFDSTLLGTERRFAVLAEDHPLARRRAVRLADFAGTTVAVDDRTGTTTLELWGAAAPDIRLRPVDGVEDWLTLIASGQAVGITPESTVAQYRRTGLVSRPVLDAQPVPVWAAWARGEPSLRPDAFIRMACEAYGRG
jgi:DNA-binding transcriptional LysR family regulator